MNLTLSTTSVLQTLANEQALETVFEKRLRPMY